MSVRVRCGSGMGVKIGHVVDCLSIMWTARSIPSPDFCCLREVRGRPPSRKTEQEGDGPQQPGKTVHSSLQLAARHGGGAVGRGEGASEGDLMGNLNFLLTPLTGDIPETLPISLRKQCFFLAVNL